MYNVQIGPPNLWSLSEKVRYLIHDPRSREDFLFFSFFFSLSFHFHTFFSETLSVCFCQSVNITSLISSSWICQESFTFKAI